jgi:mono/diheme cytochrome c family protein
MRHTIGWLPIAGALGVLLLASVAGCGGAARPTKRAAASALPRHDRFAYARGLFREICAGCHTLADAGTHGSRSDLDTSIMERIERHAREVIARTAMSEDPSRGGYMPRWQGVLSDREFDALLAYVVAVTGRNARS